MTRQFNILQLKEMFIFLYPDYKTRTYFLPPVIINRIPFESETIINQTVFKLKSSEASSKLERRNKTLDETSGACCKNTSIVSPGFQHSDLREDLSLQLVKSRLQKLAAMQNEVMFVLTQLDFSDYLSKPCYSSTIEQLQVVLPRHLEKNEYKRGDFDILLFHKKYGILIGEIKSVGSPHIQQNNSQISNDSLIKEKVKHASEQLKKAEVVIKELTKDLEPNLRIVKTVILPYVSRTDLKRVLNADVQLQKSLAMCLNATDGIHALDLCLLADNVSDCNGSWDVQQIRSWWEKCVSCKEDPLMTDGLYLDIVVRFCGQATTIRLHCIKSPRLEVRTLGDAVSVVGERMTQLILTPEQLHLLCEMPRNVFLCGPPGTGKTILLTLMALKHLQKGVDVYIISTVSVNIAASLTLKNMLEKNMAEITTDQHGDIHYVQAYLENSDDEATKLIATITKAAEKKSLFVAIDDAWAIDVDQIKRHDFVANEICALSNVNMWGSCMRHDRIPKLLHKVTLTIPLRSPPTVLEEIEKSLIWYTEDRMHMYRTNCLPAPCDGPEVIHLQHLGHKERWPTNCEECGKAVGKVLNELGVGESTAGNSTSNFGKDTMEAPPLTFGDVFVLTRSTDVQSSDFLNGLCQSGISKVRVLKTDCSLKEREDVALARNNEVILTWYYNVVGLERKVVVFLPHRNKSDDNRTDDELEAYGRNHAMSRCTAQLIVVHSSLSRESVEDIQ